MKTCAYCSKSLDDSVMECPECGRSMFIQTRTKASEAGAAGKEILPPPERKLSDLHLAILEQLAGQPDWVDASQFIMSLPLEDESQAQAAVMAIEQMIGAGLVQVKGRSRIRITPAGKELYEKESAMPGMGL